MRIWVAIALLATGFSASAQEGFPLDGTWRGQRESVGGAPVTIVMVMQWDGNKVTGVINPGPKAIQIAEAQLIPEGWKVKLAAKNASGAPIAFEGTIGELGKYNRTISGTWTEGGQTYPVRMVRE
jgi:hypothetical protein